MAGDPTREADYMAEDLMLFRSGLFSDVIVTCGPKLWNLHMNILSVRSVWFEKAIRRLLMVSSAYSFMLHPLITSMLRNC